MQVTIQLWHIIVFITLLYIAVISYLHFRKKQIKSQSQNQNPNSVEHEMVTVDLGPEEAGLIFEIHTKMNTMYSCMAMAGSWDEREHWRAQYQTSHLIFNQELERLVRIYIDEFDDIENPFNIQINFLSGKLFFCLGEKPISFR